jgi:c-di-GMP-binding flagellar brake protein YcgR
MDTLPMPLDAMPGETHRLEDFRIAAPVEIAALLERLAADNVNLGLNAPGGSTIGATLSAIDAERGVLSLAVADDARHLDALVECDEATVVGLLDSIKLQFEIDKLVLVRGDDGTMALNAAFPQELFRFQRRSGFRVRPILRSTPVAILRHPMIPDMQLSLRLLDVSIGGCALFLPNDVPDIDPGVLMNGVVLVLDADTRVHTGLRLQHVTSLNPDSGGVRLGCEMVSPGQEGLRALQRYINQTQKHRKLFVLE